MVDSIYFLPFDNMSPPNYSYITYYKRIKMYHYVYRITDKQNHKHYYGSRSSALHPKEDIGIKYFSSSSIKEFILDQKINRQNYKYKVVKMFNDRESALNYEGFYIHFLM